MRKASNTQNQKKSNADLKYRFLENALEDGFGEFGSTLIDPTERKDHKNCKFLLFIDFGKKKILPFFGGLIKFLMYKYAVEVSEIVPEALGSKKPHKKIPLSIVFCA